MNTKNRKQLALFKTTFLSAMVVATVVSSAVASADDTEIYFSDSANSGTNLSNVMFMLDTSGSMNSTDGTETRRIDRLKSAMIDVLNLAEDVNVGISAFGGQQKGGTIRYPATNLDKDSCPSASCTSLKVRADILRAEDDGVAINDGGNRRVDLADEELHLGEYSSASNENQTIWALRFDGVDIPRGANINLAQLEISSTSLQTNGSVEFIIAAEDTGHSQPLVNDSYDQLVSRFDSALGGTSERIDWASDENWSTNRPYRSPDIQTAIEEITNRADWCGGNALTVLVKTEGRRDVHSRNGTQWQSPSLTIDYDPSSVDWSDTCLSLGVSGNIVDGGNDVVESVATGTLDRSTSAVSTRNGNDEQTIGLRFSSLNVPPNATITSSYIEFSSEGANSGAPSLTIRAEDTSSASQINAVALNLRNYHAQSVAWSDIPALEAGSKLVTPSLDQLMTSVVNTPGWTSGNPVLLTLSQSSGSAGVRSFSANESSVGTAARLVVNYRQTGAELAGSPPLLRTARGDLINVVLDFQRKGNTPLVDAYLETANYLLGREVLFGKQRGFQSEDDREFRLSTPSSYTGGSVFRPPNCTESDLNAEACVNEIITGAPTYIQPESGSCSANHIVLLSDGASSDNNSESDIINLIGDSCDARNRATDSCGVDLARWLYETDHDSATPGLQNIITHTVGFNTQSDFLEDVANTSPNDEGVFYEAESASDLITVFNSVLETSLTSGAGFTAPTTTISLDNRLLNNNNLFYAMFSPSTRNHWEGNVKKFQLGLNGATGQLEVQDSNGAAALGNDGVLKDTSRSFWSVTDDGPQIAEGGAASRQELGRNIYTSIADNNGATQLLTFHENTAQITNELLGINGATAQTRASLLQWARGVDINDFDNDGDTAEVRAQMGDPLHSSQLVLEYADGGRSMLFVGTNHGFLHAIDTDTGMENFAYIPEALLDVLDPVFQDRAAASSNKSYGLDGEIVGWHNDVNENSIVDGNDTAYIYFGMRRGGNNYYALDVTDPDAPKILWTIEGGVGDFAELGQTWSRPIKSTVNYLGTDREVLFFAGGYDTANDGELVRTADSIGRGFYMVDATTGQMLSYRDATDHPSMVYSIPSDMRIVNPDGDAYANAIYVGDTGGQVWRFDINNFATTDENFLTGTVLASFGGTTAAENRQFFNEPDVAFGNSSQDGLFLNVAIGSGARPNPNSLTTEDTFYSIKDPAVFGPPRNATGDIVYPAPLEEGDMVNVTGALAQNVTTGSLADGWFFRFITDGEKSMSSALTLNNEIFFTTYIPSTSSALGNTNICIPALGVGRIYHVNLSDGSAIGGTGNDFDVDRFRNLNQLGIPPRVVAVIAEASPNVVATFVGMEAVGSETEIGPFERVFWAER